MADNIDVLESRLESLEKRVFGGSNKDALYPKDPRSSSQCTETLTNVQSKLAKSVSGKKKISKVYDRLQELLECLNPSQADEMTLSDDAKVESILAEEDFLHQQAVRLETLDQLRDTLDSEHIKAVPSLSGKLRELSQVQIQQQDQAGQLSEEISQLLMKYNAIITLLSKQFVRWDETLTRLEVADQQKA